ncbi:MAG: nucleotidyltransferase domain-containing protein [Nitrosotalea sp.]
MLEEYNITQTTLKILNQYDDNYKKSLHLREIARKTKMDVKTIQLQLKKLEKINVLSSAIRGKNKEYVLNLDNVITKYYLIMGEIFSAIVYIQQNFLIKKIMTELESKVDGTLILFGSFAKGGYTKESDVDLFFISKKKIEKNIVHKITNLVGRDINIKSIDETKFLSGLRNKDPLVSEVVSNHIVLKGADKFCDMLWRYYEAY